MLATALILVGLAQCPGGRCVAPARPVVAYHRPATTAAVVVIRPRYEAAPQYTWKRGLCGRWRRVRVR
jgi:hypothetical protein